MKERRYRFVTHFVVAFFEKDLTDRFLDLALTDHNRMCYSKPKLNKDKPYYFSFLKIDGIKTDSTVVKFYR
jgi:hypothetical protein